jgi:hypothetical protein
MSSNKAFEPKQISKKCGIVWIEVKAVLRLAFRNKNICIFR